MNTCRHTPVSASHNRAVLSNDALWEVKREHEGAALRENPRGDELVALTNLGGTPAYPGNPVSMALE